MTNQLLDRLTEFERRERVINEHTFKEMLKKYRQMLTAISKLKLKNISVELEVRFDHDPCCNVTIYNIKSKGNKTFTTYSFWSIERNNKVFEKALELIKGDDFAAVYAWTDTRFSKVI